jgi:hypothetical protein
MRRMVLSRFWDFVAYSLNTVFGRIDGRRFGVVCVSESSATFNIFYEGPDVFDGVTY